ncbi:hypothetical protein GOODEAATRI_033651 [Goodea atripinnis]|uniref:Uncharacterized protein n=1 Tax=Goodea atripinnis TaxID=208336 RepID=A0ABV0NQD0_9TELE
MKDTREDKKDILRRQLMEGLLARLQSALCQQPLNLDYLEFLTHHESIMFASFSEQIGGVSDILEALQNLHNLVQCEILANSMSCVDYETEFSPGSSRPRISLDKDTLERLLDTHLPVACIAKCLGVSKGKFIAECKNLTCQ